MGRGRIVIKFFMLSLMFVWPAVGIAGVITDVTNYFKPSNGVLIATQDDDYIVSLDASAGVMVGDLLSIVTSGEELIDPTSGAVVGRLDTVKGLLKITKVRSGFSHARPLGTISKAQKGDIVRRYQNMTAIFYDQTGAGYGLYGQLVSGLPALEWQGYYPEQKAQEATYDDNNGLAQLVFVLAGSSLKVKDSAGQVVRAFTVDDKVSTFSEASVHPSELSAGTSHPQATTPQPVVTWDQSPQKNHAQVDYVAEYPGYQTLGEFPGIVLMADFTLNDGKHFIASSDGRDLDVFVVTDRMEQVASEKNKGAGNINAVAWWRPEIEGPLYLAVTASTTKTFSFSTTTETVFTSSVYRFENGQLTLLAHDLPYLLGAFDRDSDGNKETLLGQRFDLDTVYGPIRELQLEKDGLNDVELDFELPLYFPVQGSLLADLTGDGVAETVYTRKGVLYIISNGKLEYESSKQMGGSLSRLTYDVNPGQADALFASIVFEVPPVAVDIDGDGQLELIAVSADTSVFSAPGLNSVGGESWLSVLKHENGRFVKGTLGEKLEKPIQGLTINHGKAMVVLSQLNSILNDKGQSHLLALPLEP
ncbi:MAG: hypothetical protein ACSLFC_11550 [Desulfuromonadales bacterium]